MLALWIHGKGGKLSVLLFIFLFGSLLPSMPVVLPVIGFWIKSVFNNGVKQWRLVS